MSNIGSITARIKQLSEALNDNNLSQEDRERIEDELFELEEELEDEEEDVW